MKIAELFATLRLKPESLEKIDKFMEDASKRLGKLAGKLNKSLGEKLGAGMKYAALGAGAAFGVAFKDALDFDAMLGNIAIGSDGAVGSTEVLREKILKLSKAMGVAKEEIALGVGKFVELTGDGKAAAASMETFAKVAKATKAEMADIAEVAAAMSQQMGIAPKDFEKGFSILIAGGKAGSVEFKNMAALLSEVSAAGSKFQMTGTDGLAGLSSAFQLVRQGFGGPQGANKAATSMVALMGEIGDKSKRLRKHGIRVWEKDPTGKQVRRNFRDIVKDLGTLSAQNRTELFGLDASKALDELLKTDGAWDKLTESTKKADDAQRDYDKRQALSSEKALNAWNSVKVAVAEAFTPERLKMFADILAKALETAVQLGGWIANLIGMDGGVDRQDEERAVDDFVLKNRGKKGNYEAGLRDMVKAAEGDDVGEIMKVFGPHARSENSYVAAGDGDVQSVKRLGEIAKMKLRRIEAQRKLATRSTLSSVTGAPGGAAPIQVTVQNNINAKAADVEVRSVAREEAKGVLQGELRTAAAATGSQEASP